MFDPIDKILENSYVNFHAKGLDYLCLMRTPILTLKAYFYDGIQSVMGHGEVVCPHDHRYAFSTTVLDGRCKHYTYEPIFNGELYTMFGYHTPLNGGGGFIERGEMRLGVESEMDYVPGETYFCRSTDIHTIAPEPGTVLLLCQYQDDYPINRHTSTFVPGKNAEAPSVDGLYERMSMARALELKARATALLNQKGPWE